MGLFGLFGGAFIGMPPVLQNASEETKQKCVGPVLRGEKVMSIAITEPYAGSDVAGIRTTATLSDDGSLAWVDDDIILTNHLGEDMLRAALGRTNASVIVTRDPVALATLNTPVAAAMFLSRNPSLLMVLASLHGVLSGVSSSVSSLYLVTMAPPARIGAASSLQYVGSTLGSAIGAAM